MTDTRGLAAWLPNEEEVAARVSLVNRLLEAMGYEEHRATRYDNLDFIFELCVTELKLDPRLFNMKDYDKLSKEEREAFWKEVEEWQSNTSATRRSINLYPDKVEAPAVKEKLSWDPLDWEVNYPVAELLRSKYCSCYIPKPVNISLMHIHMVCKSCQLDIKEAK